MKTETNDKNPEGHDTPAPGETDFDWQAVIDKYYPKGTLRRSILLKHSRQVADLAIEISHRHGLDLDDKSIEAGAMLHDIGIFLTDAPGIDCHGSEPYLRHGVLGAEILADEGAPDYLVEIARRHTGAGITAEDIKEFNLPLPPGNYMPHTLLEKLICYADKFYSKSGEMRLKPLERVRASMQRFSPRVAERFEKLHEQFV